MLVPTKGWCVYTHASDGKVFYVGSGTAHRPYERDKRSIKWEQHVSQLSQYDVVVVSWHATRGHALDAENALIKELRPLANTRGVGPSRSKKTLTLEERRAALRRAERAEERKKWHRELDELREKQIIRQRIERQRLFGKNNLR